MNESNYYIDESTYDKELEKYEHSLLIEAEATVDMMRPQSDNPLRDTLEDIRMNAGVAKQKIKHGIQNVKQVGTSAKKSFDDALGWVKKIASSIRSKQYKDMAEEITDPDAKSNFFKVVKNLLINGSLWKAGLLLNPLIIVVRVCGWFGKNQRMQKIRNDIITEIQTEIEVLDDKINNIGSYSSKEEQAQKYKLMRARNELKKKLFRAQGAKLKKVI